MYGQSTKMVALSTLLAFSTAVNGAAHPRPQPANLEARDPQFDTSAFGGFLGQLSSLFGGFTLPTGGLTLPTGFPTALPTAATTTVSVKSSSTKASSSSLQSSSTSKIVVVGGSSSGRASTAVASASSAKASTGVASASSVKASTGAVSASIGSSSGLQCSSKSRSAVSVASGSSQSASSKPASGSVVSGSGAKSSSKVASASVTSQAAASSTAVVTSATPSSTTSTAKSTSSTSSPAVTSTSAAASATVSLSGPSVTLTAGTVVGSSLPVGIEQFLGIPYAQPPVGDLRLKPPVPYTGNFGVLNAVTPPLSCPQFAQNLTGNYSAGGLQSFIDEFVFVPTAQSEDCLTVNIWRPNTTTSASKLPVVFWIHGGGFEFGSTSMFNGSFMVQRSMSLGEPIIFVEANYRLGGFGFLAGADLAAEHSTNIGLRDQRLGLQWNADNIAAFGGDASKVTIWGESAGAISSCYQTVLNGGNNTYNGQALFRGSIHDSGSFAPADNVTAPQAQAIYDHVVSETGCQKSTAADRLACLRSVDYNVLHNATNSVPGFGGYRSADLSYLPRPDTGDSFYSLSAEYAVAFGLWTHTPFIIGDQQDEGTILAIVQNNITNNDLLVEYLASWFPGNPNAVADVQGLAALYPDDIAGGQPDGSPFNTGSANNIYPEYKRLAAILGDIVFIITRRAFLSLAASQAVPCWSYLSTYLQGFQTFGTLHGSDLAYLFNSLFYNVGPTIAIETYYISFINHLDPNKISSTTNVNWPTWNSTTPINVEFGGGNPGYMNDTFRADVYQYLLTHVTGFRV